MGQKNKTILLWISFFADLCINLAVVYTLLMIYKSKLNSSFGTRATVCTIVLIIATSFIYFLFNIYSLKRFEKLHKLLIKTLLAQATSLFVTVAIVIFFANNIILSLTIVLLAYGISTVLLCTKRTITTKLIHSMRTKERFRRKIVIVGNGNGALSFVEQIEDNTHFGYDIIGCITNSNKPLLKKIGGFDQIDEIIKNENPYEVVISLDSDEKIEIQEIINCCERHGTRALIIPVTYRYFKSKCQIDMIGDLPIINTRAIPLDNIANAVMKRTMDIVISLIMIILTSPIMLFAMIGVKLSSKGRVIFKQERVGRNNKIFTMYKFRSMRENDESDTAWTTNEDPRKTRFGNFMRKTGIDELPQLFNVLFGSMSIIGPRPELPKYVEEYSKVIPLYMIKHQVKPGITGLAQIYGYRGNTSIEKRIEMDIQYIENWSVFNDIKILVITPFKMFNRNEKYVK